MYTSGNLLSCSLVVIFLFLPSVSKQFYHFLSLQDFEALTPNLLARTIETVEGGGLIVLLLRSLSSLTSLYTMVMVWSYIHHNYYFFTSFCFRISSLWLIIWSLTIYKQEFDSMWSPSLLHVMKFVKSTLDIRVFYSYAYSLEVPFAIDYHACIKY